MQIIARSDAQRRLQQHRINLLREIAAIATKKHASVLNTIAREMEINNRLARQDDYDFNFYSLADPTYVGHSGSAATNAEGAWRALFIRQMRSRLPDDLNLIPQPYATMAALSAWAGIDGVSSPLVRSILKRGHA